MNRRAQAEIEAAYITQPLRIRTVELDEETPFGSLRVEYLERHDNVLPPFIYAVYWRGADLTDELTEAELQAIARRLV